MSKAEMSKVGSPAQHVARKEETRSLASVRTLAPLSKSESNLVWHNKRVTLRGFFGLPPGVIIERVKIGHFSFVEMSSFGKSVAPGQPLVIVLENVSNEPQSIKDATLVFESHESMPVDHGATARRAQHKHDPEPLAGKGTTLLDYTLIFGAGIARVGFIVRELSTLDEIWTNTCALDEVVVMGTTFKDASLMDWRGMVVPQGTPVEIAFVPRQSTTRARAVVRLQKLEFPQAE